jgi:hypothetical protein
MVISNRDVVYSAGFINIGPVEIENLYVNYTGQFVRQRPASIQPVFPGALRNSKRISLALRARDQKQASKGEFGPGSGVVAVKVSNGVYVGWRMMGYEHNPTSPSSISYNVYRAGTRLATVTNSTNYLDSAGTTSSTYTVSAVVNGTECPQSPSVTTWAQNYLTIPLSPPPTGPNGGTYSANDGEPGDLDGDGRLDLVLATAAGEVHALDATGAELPGWPVE